MRLRAPIAVALAVAALTGCSNLDLETTPIQRVSHGRDSGDPYVEDDRDERAAAKLRRLQSALKQWEAGSTRRRAYHVGCGDTLIIEVVSLRRPGEVTALERQVEDDGCVDLPWIGLVEADGLTVDEIEQSVAAAYRGNYLKHPEVDAKVKDYASAAVLVTGAVRKPGMHYLRQDASSILEVLFLAGGLSSAAGDALVLLRAPEPGDGPGAELPGSDESVAEEELLARIAPAQRSLQAVPHRGDTNAVAAADGVLASNRTDAAGLAADSPASSNAAPSTALSRRIEIDLGRLIDEGDVRLNLAVREGDILFVASRKSEYIYVMGYVRGPGRIAMPEDEPITALNAMIMAGGPDRQARVQNSYIIRGMPGGNQVIEVDLIKVARGVRPDVPMNTGDTLVIGSGALMKFMEIFRIGGNMTYSPAVP